MPVMSLRTRGALLLALVAALSVVAVGLLTGGRPWALAGLAVFCAVSSFVITQRLNAKRPKDPPDPAAR
jgi:hypothetical protein